MAKQKDISISESEMLNRAMNAFKKTYAHLGIQDIKSWKECGESGFFVFIKNKTKSMPSEYMGFEVLQKVLEES